MNEQEVIKKMILIFQQLWHIEWVSSDSKNYNDICEAIDLISQELKSLDFEFRIKWK